VIVAAGFRTVATLFALVCATSLSTACSDRVDGTPHAPTTEALSAAPTEPRRLALDEVDPCGTLTPEQEVSLQLSQRQAAAHTRTDIRGCQWDGPFGIYDVTILTTNGVQDIRTWPDQRFGLLEGYPTVETHEPGSKPDQSCVLFIDVAPTQMIGIGFENASSVKRSRTESCATVGRMAALVLDSVDDRSP
jgi:hypothetical protein